MTKKATPSSSHQWSQEDGTGACYLSGTGITWSYTPGGAGGRFGEVARDQSLEDFLASGAPVPGVPAKVEAALRAALAKAGHRVKLARVRPIGEVLGQSGSNASTEEQAYAEWLKGRDGK